MERAMVVCEALRLNCTFSFYDGQEYGDYDEISGNITGLLGAIDRGQFDTALPNLTPTYRRAKAMDFSNIFFYATLLMATRAPEENDGSRNFGISFAFHIPIWFALAISLILISLFLSVGLRKLDSEKSSILKIFLETILSLVVQSEYKDKCSKFLSLKLMLTFWAAMSIVLMTSCTGFLCSLNISKNANLPYKDLESFVACLTEKKCRMISATKSFSFLQLLTDTPILGARVVEAIKINPIEIVPEAEIPKRILEEKTIYLVWPGPSTVFLYHTKGYTNCEFYSVDAPYKVFGAFPLKKKSPYLALLNRMAGPFHESGSWEI